MPLTSWRARMEEILVGLEKIERATGGIGQEEFASNAERVGAVRSELAEISQAVADVPAEVSELYPEVPWAFLWRSAVQRDADPGALWKLVRDEVPGLRAALAGLLESED